MHARHQSSGLTWIDLESPSALEVRQVASEFGIAEQIAEELVSPFSKPRAEFYGPYIFVVMHFPALRHTHKEREQEVDFVIGRSVLITAHYDTIDPLHKFAKVFDVNSTLQASPWGDHAGFLFFFALRKLYRSIDHELDYLRHELSIIEEHIFSEREVEMVVAISRTLRALLNLRQTIEPHREVLRILEDRGAAFFGEPFLPYLRALSGEYYRVHNHIMRTTDALHELRETNNSLLTTKQNETMKVFTVMAFTTFPLTLIATIFGMGVRGTPFAQDPYGFWIIIVLMLMAIVLMFMYFRRKKWL